LALYGVTLCVLAPHLTLWLDEVLTLVGARKPDLSSLVVYINNFAGSTPLTFLPPRWTMAVLGNSPFAARLPSIIASLFSCWGIYLLAKRARQRGWATRSAHPRAAPGQSPHGTS